MTGLGLLRLLHFDIKTAHQYGDQLLFECVRQVFNGFGGGACFDLRDTFPLRQRADEKLIDRINAEYDGIVVGGGGLFLKSSNPNPRSGWQWDISLDLLARLKKPIIVFAVGYNRFFGQDEFEPVFSEHIAEVIRRSVFFGLRNTGSVEAIRSYVGAELGEQVRLQPCPTSFSRHLFPDLVTSTAEGRRLGLQIGLEPPHSSGGFTSEQLFPRIVTVVDRLQAEGWDVTIVAHKPADMAFVREHPVPLHSGPVQLFGSADDLYSGVRVYSDLPIVLGGRGHSQMIPFGLGNVPLSIRVSPKLEFFARDVGHPEWVLDPFAADFEDRVCRAVDSTAENLTSLRDEIRGHHDRFLQFTLDNLATIYERMTGKEPDRSFAPYTPRERRLAGAGYSETYRRLQVESRRSRQLSELRSRLTSARAGADAAAAARDAAVDQVSKLRRQTAPAVILASARRLARAGQLAQARRALAAVEYLAPTYLAHARRPRWSTAPWRFIPSFVLSAAVRIRRIAGQPNRRTPTAASSRERRHSRYPPRT